MKKNIINRRFFLQYLGYVSIAPTSLAFVTNEGWVYVVFYLSELRTRCKLSIKYFPFDTQVLRIVFNIWNSKLKLVSFEITKDMLYNYRQLDGG